MKYLLSLRVFEEVISPTQNSDSVIRQDKEASFTSARPSPVLTVKNGIHSHIQGTQEASVQGKKKKSINAALHCSHGEDHKECFIFVLGTTHPSF